MMYKPYPIQDVLKVCRVTQNSVEQFIELDWIIPAIKTEMLFDEEDIARINFIQVLQNDLGVNDEAVPIILHLVDQLNRLHLEIKH